MKNLSAEMARCGVSNADIQRVLGCSPKTVTNKLNETTAFSVHEALNIRDAFFPDMTVEYLFARSDGERADSA